MKICALFLLYNMRYGWRSGQGRNRRDRAVLRPFPKKRLHPIVNATASQNPYAKTNRSGLPQFHIAASIVSATASNPCACPSPLGVAGIHRFSAAGSISVGPRGSRYGTAQYAIHEADAEEHAGCADPSPAGNVQDAHDRRRRDHEKQRDRLLDGQPADVRTLRPVLQPQGQDS